MAIVGESNDPMRDIIAQAAEKLTIDEPESDGDTDVDAGAGGDGNDSVDDAATAAATEAADAAVVAEAADAADAARTEKPAEEVVPGKVVADKPTEATAAGKVVAKTEKDKQIEAFAKEHGLKAKDSMGRENRIPHSVVATRIVPNAIKKEKVKWEAEVLVPERNKTRIYEERLGTIEKTEQIMFSNPRQYLSMLAAGVPGYSQLFDELRGGKPVVEGSNVADGTKIAQRDDDPEPQPDAKDKDGNVIGYTKEGYAALRAWDRREASREAEKRVETRFKPLMERESRTQQQQQLNQTVDDVITNAAAWPGFTANHAAILEELAKGKDALDSGPKMHRALQDAYNTVMFGAVTKTRETEEEARERYFAEFQTSLRKAPRSTASTGRVARHEPSADDENLSSDDRMRNIIAGVANKLK